MAKAWTGEFVIGEAWAAYRGPAGDNTLHEHVALQIAVGVDTDVRVETADGRVCSGRAWLVRPGVAHGLSAPGAVSLLYVEPQSRVASALLGVVGDGEVEPLPAGWLGPFAASASPAAWLRDFEASLSGAGRALDPRLGRALDHLAQRPGAATVAEAVAASGLSESRLRDLAREQLGLPLSTWLLWRKLERAARELAAGASLGQAALAGGFADQAHFSRTMRRMFGVTPGAARQALG